MPTDDAVGHVDPLISGGRVRREHSPDARGYSLVERCLAGHSGQRKFRKPHNAPVTVRLFEVPLIRCHKRRAVGQQRRSHGTACRTDDVASSPTVPWPDNRHLSTRRHSNSVARCRPGFAEPLAGQAGPVQTRPPRESEAVEPSAPDRREHRAGLSWQRQFPIRPLVPRRTTSMPHSHRRLQSRPCLQRAVGGGHRH